MAKVKKTEQEEQEDNRKELARAAALPAPVAASTMLDIFSGVDEELEAKLGKMERRNPPPMIKPSDIPIGVAIQGTIVKFVKSPSSVVKGNLIWLNHKGQDYTFPCTGSIRSALAPGVKEDEKTDNAELMKALSKEVGKFFYARRLPNKTSKTYGKDMFIFDVRTGKVD